MKVTKLSLEETLPLTCSRAGTCCHGNKVLLNPWELARIAREKELSSEEFRSRFCVDGGIVLHFNGAKDHRGKAACSQYIPNFGCSVHAGRPLACRLFPLGRQIQHETAEYIFEGTSFPCFNGCVEVRDLPQLSVKDYLIGQETAAFELAQDAYLEIMQNIADIAFTLLLDTGLAESGDTKTLIAWKKLGQESAEQLAKQLGDDWLNSLMLPTLDELIDNCETFANAHNELLQTKAQQEFGALLSLEEVHLAAVKMMNLALYLALALGADARGLSEHWIEVAKSHGAV